MTPMRAMLALSFLFAGGAGAATGYDANGVALGASEKAVLQQFPSAHCQALQWNSHAADRRCDDSKAVIGGVISRITFYLKKDRVQAFDVRFESKDADILAAFLKKRYGPPSGETREKIEKAEKGKADKAKADKGDKRPPPELYKVHWEQGGERAVLTSQNEKRRALFTVSRGDFEEEIYRVR
jgi:hypothetical protein